MSNDQQSPPALSERELEVLKLVATGATNNQVARELSISVNTVKVHLNNIFTRLGVQSRTEATLYAVRHGWIEVQRADGSMAVATPTVAEVIAPSVETAPVALDPIPSSEPLPDARAPVAPLASPVGPAGVAAPSRASWRRPRVIVAAVIVALLLGVVIYPLASSTQAWRDAFGPRAVASPAPVASAAPTLVRWQLKAPLGAPREEMAVATVNGLVYVIGGMADGKPLANVNVYDPATDQWSTRTSKPTALQAMGAAIVGGRMYVPGGCDAQNQPSPLVDVYDPQRDTWQTGVPLPKPLCRYAISALEGKLYLFGGWNGTDAVADVWTFDPVRGEWSAHTPLPTARADAAAAVVNDRIVLAGGRAGNAVLNQVLVFDSTQERGNPQAWSVKTAMRQPRAKFGLVSLAGNLYAIGGANGARVENERYDTRTNAWAAFEESPVPLTRVGGAVGMETKLYVIGGAPDNPSALVQEYTALYRFFLPNAPGAP
ncbi:MAG: kelch repeat-containing protein [Chloroflexota bacterium]